MGTRLVQELKREHEAIVERFQRARELGLETDEGRKALQLAGKSLLAHLRRENEQFYPALREVAKGDDELTQLLELFDRDIALISAQAQAFFARWGAGGAGLEYAREFGALWARLKLRISNEERALYDQYDRLAEAGRLAG